MKKWLTYVSLGVLLVACLFTAVTMGQMPRTANPDKAAFSVYELQQDPEHYDSYAADGAADAIIQQNLANTHAVNDVTSIVFDFRGYDTMGEAFILITAVAGVTVLLRKTEKEKKEDREKNGQQ